jgi:hypothetical protein
MLLSMHVQFRISDARNTATILDLHRGLSKIMRGTYARVNGSAVPVIDRNPDKVISGNIGTYMQRLCHIDTGLYHFFGGN